MSNNIDTAWNGFWVVWSWFSSAEWIRISTSLGNLGTLILAIIAITGWKVYSKWKKQEVAEMESEWSEQSLNQLEISLAPIRIWFLHAFMAQEVDKHCREFSPLHEKLIAAKNHAIRLKNPTLEEELTQLENFIGRAPGTLNLYVRLEKEERGFQDIGQVPPEHLKKQIEQCYAYLTSAQEEIETRFRKVRDLLLNKMRFDDRSL